MNGRFLRLSRRLDLRRKCCRKLIRIKKAAIICVRLSESRRNRVIHLCFLDANLAIAIGIKNGECILNGWCLLRPGVNRKEE